MRLDLCFELGALKEGARCNCLCLVWLEQGECRRSSGFGVAMRHVATAMATAMAVWVRARVFVLARSLHASVCVTLDTVVGPECIGNACAHTLSPRVAVGVGCVGILMRSNY